MRIRGLAIWLAFGTSVCCLQGAAVREFRGLSDVVLDGGGALVTLGNDPCSEVSGYEDGWVFRGCTNLVLRGWRFTTSHPVSCRGRIVKIEPEVHTYEVAFEPGREPPEGAHLMGVNSIGRDGIPDKTIEFHGRPIAHRRVGRGRIRIVAWERTEMGKLFVGQSMVFRYSVYGPCVLRFSECANVRLEGVSIERASGMGVVIEPPCRDFYFSDFTMGREGAEEYFATGADGIHIVGLSGRLVLQGCRFRGLGDDALNVHAKNAEAMAIDTKESLLEVACRDLRRCESPLPEGWCERGDKVVIYDGHTLLEKGRVTVEEVRRLEGSPRLALKLSPLPEGVRAGDFLGNSRDYPKVELRDCLVERTRARGFLLQSEEITVERCRFRDISLPGIIVAPDFRYWNECGPTRRCRIEDCRFERCAVEASPAAAGALVVKTSHDNQIEACQPGVHQCIIIRRCRFQGARRHGIFAQGVDGLVLESNEFHACGEPQGTRLVDCRLTTQQPQGKP